ncbi:sulfite exporter TauE/SafE family protein [Granulosicoccus sp. 3-233]|uniref:sulfite exporter TauE/SafE family protein n=1 Tax=Granulosicoccus sp. 3-233 TaxID=3417969 RepID=UPI003D339D2C
MINLQWLPPELEAGTALVLVVISFVTSAISATFGLGGGVAMLIALLSLVPPIVALPVHALVQVGSNAGRAWMLRPHIMRTVFLWFLPGSILGILIASQLIVSLPTTVLQVALAIFILWSVWAPGMGKRELSDPAFIAVGAVTSFATMFLGATGPLLAAFLSPSLYGRDRTVATHAACMTLQHLLKLLAFGFLGFVLAEWLPLVVAMIISGLLGTHFGGTLLRRFSEDSFKKIFKVILTLLALRLLVRSTMA